MPTALNLILSEKEVGELNDFLQELPAKYANPILNYLQSKINAQRKAEQEREIKAEQKGRERDPGYVLDRKEVEDIPIEEIAPFVND